MYRSDETDYLFVGGGRGGEEDWRWVDLLGDEMVYLVVVWLE
jgi:hypothetical protein